MKQEVINDFQAGVWIRFKSGDQEAFAILYNQYVDQLYSYGTKLCRDEEAVKDALQELFLELFLKRERIKIAQENLRFYLLVALKHNLVKRLRADRNLVHKFNETVDFEPEYSIEFQIMETEKDAEINRRVVKALNQLPAKQKEAIYLRFNEALEYSEIAGILEITVESVRKQVHRALKTVREIIGKESDSFLFALFVKRT